MAVESREHEHTATQAAPPRGKWRRRLTTGGWIRAAWVTPLAFVLATLLVLGCRAWLDYHPLNEFQVLLTAWMVIVPLGFLVGIGGFDYWVYWIWAGPRGRRITRATARARGRTTSASTPTTR